MFDQLVATVMRDALGEPGPDYGEFAMSKLRKYRLVCACLNFLGGLFRLVAALVDVASNYSGPNAAEMGHEVPA